VADNLNAVILGVAVGSVYGLIAIGYNVVYAATRVFNLAQGDLVMAGVLLAYFFLVVQGWAGFVAFLVIVASVAAISLVEERAVVRPALRRADSIGWFITTLAFSGIVRNITQNIYGNQEARSIPSPLPSSALEVGPVIVSWQMVLAFLTLVAVMVGLELFYRRAWWGQAMRATAEDREAASLRGIAPGKVSMLAFLIGGVVAGLGGFVLAPIVFSDVNIGLSLSLKGFVAIAVGGFGSIRGAIAGAWALGITEQLTDLHFGAAYESLAGLGLLLLVLVLRPVGIFGAAPEREV
jgi:branched-chain amino acid transport system permease protein